MGNDSNLDRYSRLYFKKPRSSPRKAARLAAIAFAVIAAAFIATAIGPPFLPADNRMSSILSPASTDKTEEEIKDELGDAVAEGMMNVSMASTVTVDEDMNAHLSAVNIPQNHLDQTITLIGEDGTELYASPILPPGTALDTAELAGPVPEGRSNATAVFTGYDPTTGQAAGTIALEITLEKEGNADE